MGKFNLDDYEGVDVRLKKFWDAHPDGRVETEVEVDTEVGWVVTRAELYQHREDQRPFASGYAKSPIKGGANAEGTHPLETCETSAIGRALANGNFVSEGKQRASREEMEGVAQPNELPVNLLPLVEEMNEDEREQFKRALTERWPGIGLSEVPPDLSGDVTTLALGIVSGRYAQPGEEPF